MLNASELTEYYKSLSNTEILEILETPGSYEPTAIEVAKRELSCRQLTEDEIADAKAPLLAKQLKLEQKKKKEKVIERPVSDDLLSDEHILYEPTPQVNKLARVILIVSTLLFLYLLYKNFRALRFVVGSIFSYPISIPMLLLFAIQPVGIFLFWKRRSVGWSLLVISIGYFGFFSLWVVARLLYTELNYGLRSEFNIFSYFLPHVLQLLMASGIVIMLCNSGIRKLFEIDPLKMRYVLFGIIIFSFMYLYLLSNGFR